MKITVVGSGNMGRAVSRRLLAGGAEVFIADRSSDKAEALKNELKSFGKVNVEKIGEAEGEMVVLAVPYSEAAEVVKAYGSNLAQKTVIDITNPINQTYSGLVTPVDSSAAEEIAKIVPSGTEVIKAFNTTFAKLLALGKVAGVPLDVLVAGNDETSKKSLVGILEKGGVRAIDVGNLERARVLEGMALVNITLQSKLGTNFGSAWKLLA
jgi:NADPH-dependent F420 reductase